MVDIHSEMIKCREKGIPCAIVTVIRVTGAVPQRVSAKMLVKQDGTIYGTIGGGAVEKRCIENTLELISNNQSKIITYDLTKTDTDKLDMNCGGKMEVFVDVITLLKRLIIFGGGHIAKPLSKMGKLLGFAVIVIDNRIEFANKVRFSYVDETIHGAYSDILNTFMFTNNDYIVIITHGHKHDEEILRVCITKSFFYMGMIGSKKKVRTLLNKLKDEGVHEKMLNKINSPIGLDIGADSPEEIATAIIAECIAIANEKDIKSCKISI